MLMYLSAIFYTTDVFSPSVQKLFYLNPVYAYISYFRQIVLDQTVPSVWLHLLCAVYAFIAVGVGCLIYKKLNYKFLYYM